MPTKAAQQFVQRSDKYKVEEDGRNFKSWYHIDDIRRVLWMKFRKLDDAVKKGTLHPFVYYEPPTEFLTIDFEFKLDDLLKPLIDKLENSPQTYFPFIFKPEKGSSHYVAGFLRKNTDGKIIVFLFNPTGTPLRIDSRSLTFGGFVEVISSNKQLQTNKKDDGKLVSCGPLCMAFIDYIMSHPEYMEQLDKDFQLPKFLNLHDNDEINYKKLVMDLRQEHYRVLDTIEDTELVDNSYAEISHEVLLAIDKRLERRKIALDQAEQFDKEREEAEAARYGTESWGSGPTNPEDEESWADEDEGSLEPVPVAEPSTSSVMKGNGDKLEQGPSNSQGVSMVSLDLISVPSSTDANKALTKPEPVTEHAKASAMKGNDAVDLSTKSKEDKGDKLVPGPSNSQGASLVSLDLRSAPSSPEANKAPIKTEPVKETSKASAMQPAENPELRSDVQFVRKQIKRYKDNALSCLSINNTQKAKDIEAALKEALDAGKTNVLTDENVKASLSKHRIFGFFGLKSTKAMIELEEFVKPQGPK